VLSFPVLHKTAGFSNSGLNLVIARNEEAMKAGVGPKDGKFECCTALKAEALMKCLDKHGFDALLLAIRRDEHGIRAKERVFSPRDKEFRWNYRDQPLEMWDQYQAQGQSEIDETIQLIAGLHAFR